MIDKSISILESLTAIAEEFKKRKVTFQISPEFMATVEDLGKWLGVKGVREVLLSALALLMTCREVVEAGGILCVHEQDGSVHEVDIRASGKKVKK